MIVVPPSAQTLEEWRPGVRTLLRVSSASGARDLCIVEQWHDPGCGAPTHRHRGVEEVIVVLEGCWVMWGMQTDTVVVPLLERQPVLVS